VRQLPGLRRRLEAARAVPSATPGTDARKSALERAAAGGAFRRLVAECFVVPSEVSATDGLPLFRRRWFACHPAHARPATMTPPVTAMMITAHPQLYCWRAVRRFPLAVQASTVRFAASAVHTQ
jgi:hypothetical protein